MSNIRLAGAIKRGNAKVIRRNGKLRFPWKPYTSMEVITNIGLKQLVLLGNHNLCYWALKLTYVMTKLW